MEQKKDLELEEMLLLIGTSANKAAKASKTQTLDYFYDKFKRLEGLVSEKAAYTIVEKGEFSLYRNGDLEKYFTLAGKVVDKIKKNMFSEKLPKNWFVKQFYSIESLENFLKKEKEESEEKNIQHLKVGRYRILNSSDSQAKKYMNDLIENRRIEVGDHEHWARADNQGLRGQNILVYLANEIRHMCSDSGLEYPRIRILHGQKAMTIDEKTSLNLRILRDKAEHTSNYNS